MTGKTPWKSVPDSRHRCQLRDGSYRQAICHMWTCELVDLWTQTIKDGELMHLTQQFQITRYDRGEVIVKDDLVVEEYPLTIKVNGHRTAAVLCSPDALEPLVLGFLLSEGVVKSHREVASLSIDEEESIAEVELLDRSYVPLQDQERTRSSGCGKGAIYLDVVTTCKRNESPVRFSARSILDLSNEFNKESELFLATGGVHSAAIANGEELLFFHEDIGRHNAVDKVIGAADLGGVDIGDKMLLCSGRISSEMLIKAAKRSIPVVVSRSAPTGLAVELALRLKVTLIGFARGAKMNIYSAPERVVV